MKTAEDRMTAAVGGCVVATIVIATLVGFLIWKIVQ